MSRSKHQKPAFNSPRMSLTPDQQRLLDRARDLEAERPLPRPLTRSEQRQLPCPLIPGDSMPVILANSLRLIKAGWSKDEAMATSLWVAGYRKKDQ